MARQYIDPQEYLDKIAALEKDKDEARAVAEQAFGSQWINTVDPSETLSTADLVREVFRAAENVNVHGIVTETQGSGSERYAAWTDGHDGNGYPSIPPAPAISRDEVFKIVEEKIAAGEPVTSIDGANLADFIDALNAVARGYQSGFETYRRGFEEYQENPQYQNLHSQINVRDTAIETLQAQLLRVTKERDDLLAAVPATPELTKNLVQDSETTDAELLALQKAPGDPGAENAAQNTIDISTDKIPGTVDGLTTGKGTPEVVK